MTQPKDTCLFIPQELNLMCKPTRNSSLKKGVQFLKGRKKPYRAYINIDGKSTGLGYYHTEEEANERYKIARLSRVDDLYLKYKDKLTLEYGMQSEVIFGVHDILAV